MENKKLLFQELEKQFESIFGKSLENAHWFFAPGRVNLIGDHIDYCGGSVLPATLQMGTYAIARATSSSEVVMQSTLMENRVSFPFDTPVFLKSDGWGNYPKGIFAEYRKRGCVGSGLEILFHGDIPGGGLSSSASIEICTALIIESFNQFHLSSNDLQNRKEMAWLAQHSENRFMGLNCGIMDQAAIALGKKGHALLMDCRDLEVQTIPIELGEYCLLIGNTCKARTLVDSKYNERRAEVESALKIIQQQHSITHLCEIPISELEKILELLGDAILSHRTQHVISENKRVHEAVKALKNNQLETFGKLLSASHQSLREDYEVTGKELDTLVEASLEQTGVLGARMTGAGFGGCMIALIHKNHIENFKENVTIVYEKQIGYPPEFHEIMIGSGAEEIFKE